MWDWLRSRFGGGADDGRAVDEELRAHLEMQTDDLVRQGMEPAEARRESLRRFGNPVRVRERVRAERGSAAVDELLRNVRFAARSLLRNPVFAVTFVLTTAGTVALGSTAWAVGDATLWRGLPWPDADRLLQVGLYDARAGGSPSFLAVDGATWEQVRDRAPDLQAAAYAGWVTGVNLSTDGAAAFVQSQRVGAGYFRTLGVAPAQGREFTPAEDVPDGPALAVLSHTLWRNTFGGDPGIVGRTIRLKGEPHTVTGVMPEGFRTPSGADVWTPLRPSRTGEGSGTNYAIVARAPAGMTRADAIRRIEAIPAPDAWRERGGEPLMGAVPLEDVDRAGRRATVGILLGGIAIMLLIGWGNLAGLQVARTLARSAEMATRRALGGGRSALVRQLSVEILLTAGIGGVLGIGFAILAAPGVESALQSRFATWQPLPGRGAIAGAGAVCALAAMVVSGVWPMARVVRTSTSGIASSAGRVRGGRHLGRRLVLAGQLALVTVLAFSAGLLARSYQHLDGLEAGFDPTGVYTATLSLDDARFAEAETVLDLFRGTLEALERRPEVASAAVALTLPYERPLNMPFRHGSAEDPLLANVVYVTPGFFETLRIPLRAGRAFGRGDDAASGTVAVVNQAFVERYLPGGAPLGAVVTFGSGIGDVPIVGVVGNVQQSAGWGGVSQPVWETPTLYFSAAQLPSGFLRGIHVWFSPTWVVRGTQGTTDLAAATGEALRAVADELPLARSGSLQQVVDRAFARQRMEAGFLLLMAFFALALAGVGLYGLVSQDVLERKGEMGVRMALGASPAAAVMRTAMSGVRLAALGLAAGVALTFPASGLLDSLIWGVTPRDPVTLAMVVGTLGILTAAASFIPALRVGRLDPARVLRAAG